VCVSNEDELVSFYYGGTLDSDLMLCASTKSAPIELTRLLTVERKVTIMCEDGVDCKVSLSRYGGFGASSFGPLSISGVVFSSPPGVELARSAVDVDRDSTVTLTDVSFIGLTSLQGSAIQIIGSGATTICNNCAFLNNTAAHYGGAAHITRGGSTFFCHACTFTGNTAGIRGGSIDTDQSGDVTLTDCFFSEGKSPKGKSVYVSEFSTLVAENSEFEEIVIEVWAFTYLHISLQGAT
jgi:hypothetical protein